MREESRAEERQPERERETQKGVTETGCRRSWWGLFFLPKCTLDVADLGGKGAVITIIIISSSSITVITTITITITITTAAATAVTLSPYWCTECCA